MAENDLSAVAFPELDDAQMAALERCRFTKLRDVATIERMSADELEAAPKAAGH